MDAIGTLICLRATRFSRANREAVVGLPPTGRRAAGLAAKSPKSKSDPIAKSDLRPGKNAIGKPFRSNGRGDKPPEAIEFRGGVHAIIKRFGRRVPATYRLAHDPLAAATPRLLARVLSGYERAKTREVMLILFDTVPLFDGPLLWLLRRGIFALAGRPRGDDDPTLDMVVPPSGWVGNLLALGSWAAALTGVYLIAAA